MYFGVCPDYDDYIDCNDYIIIHVTISCQGKMFTIVTKEDEYFEREEDRSYYGTDYP